MGVSIAWHPFILLTKQVISAYQTEQDDAEGAESVFDEQHENHAEGNPEQTESDEAFHDVAPMVCLILIYEKMK